MQDIYSTLKANDTKKIAPQNTCIIAFVALTAITSPTVVFSQQDLTWVGNSGNNSNGTWNTFAGGPRPWVDNGPSPTNQEFNHGDSVTFSGPTGSQDVSVRINQIGGSTLGPDNTVRPGSITFSPNNSSTQFVISSDIGSQQISSRNGTHSAGTLAIRMDGKATIDTGLEGNFIITGEKLLTLGRRSQNLNSLEVASNANVIVYGSLGSTTSNGNVTNQVGGTVNIRNIGSISGTLTNSGTAIVAGDVNKVENKADAQVTFDGVDTFVSDTVSNDNGKIDVIGAVTVGINGTHEVSNTGNNAEITIKGTNGVLNGRILNDQGADTKVTNNGQVFGTITNKGNGSTTDINRGGTVIATSGDAIINEDGGKTNVLGAGVVVGNVKNNGGGYTQVHVGGEIQGDVTNAQGGEVFIQNDGTVTGNVTNQSGNANSAGGKATIGGTVETNVSNGNLATVTVRETGAIKGNLINDGVANIAGNIGTIDNRSRGEVTFTGDMKIIGPNVSSGGTVMINRGVTKLEDGVRIELQGDHRIVNDNSGRFALNGTLKGDIRNNGAGDNANQNNVLDMNGSIEGELDNAGIATVSGDITTIENQGGANLTIDGSMTTTDRMINRGTTTIGDTANPTAVTMDANGGIRNTADGNLNVNSILNVDGSVENGGFSSTGTANSTLTVNGTMKVTNGGVTNQRGGQTVVNTGGTMTTTGLVRNNFNGSTTVSGNLNGNVSNFSTGSTTVNAGGTITGDVRNAFGGRTAVNGTVTGKIDNTNSGTTTVGSTGRVIGNVTNQSDGKITVVGRVEGDITNLDEGNADIDAGANVTGTLTNQNNSSASVAGSVGEIQNKDGGTLIFDGQATVSGTTTNEGYARINQTASLTATGLVTNESGGAMLIEGTLAGTIENNAANGSGEGFRVATSGKIAGTLNNNSHADLAGEVATINNVNITSVITVYDNLKATGLISNTGEINVDSGKTLDAAGGLNNNNFSNLNLNAGSTLKGALTNRGTTDVSNGVVIDGPISNFQTIDFADGTTVKQYFSNSGTVKIDGKLTLDGSLTGSSGSSINMQDDFGDDILEIKGGAEFEQGSVIYIDADLSGTGPAQLDKININGVASGSVALSFDNLSSEYGELNLEVMTYGANSTLGAVPTGLGSVGGLVYTLKNEGTSLILTTASNPNLGSLAGAVTLTQSLIGSVINRPSSPFVTGGASADQNDPCSPGGWGRFIGGEADATGTTSSRTLNGDDISYQSSISASYAGIQVGGDFSCFGGHFNGWDMSFGGILGVNQGKTTQPIFGVDSNSAIIPGLVLSNNKTKFDQVYGGLYMSAARDRLLFDLQYRHERTSFDLTNDGVGAERLDILDQSFGSSAHTISGSASYVVPISEENRINFVPTVGFAYTKTETDPIFFEDGAYLQIDDATTEVGFLGGSVAMTKIRPSGKSALTYFGTATFYKDFADPTRSVFYDSPTAAGLESFSSNLGEYGEVSLGLNYTKLLDPGRSLGNSRQLNASIRLDGRFGETLDSWGVTGQLRLQF